MTTGRRLSSRSDHVSWSLPIPLKSILPCLHYPSPHLTQMSFQNIGFWTGKPLFLKPEHIYRTGISDNLSNSSPGTWEMLSHCRNESRFNENESNGIGFILNHGTQKKRRNTESYLLFAGKNGWTLDVGVVFCVTRELQKSSRRHYYFFMRIESKCIAL